MEKRPGPPAERRFWAVLRWIGVVLSAAPVLFMLVTGVIGSAASGRLQVDVFPPAELFFLAFPGMILMALAAVKQRVYARLSAALPVAAAAALILCQGLAFLSGAASGQRESGRVITAALAGLLLLFDLAAVSAPVVGLLSIRKLRRTAS